MRKILVFLILIIVFKPSIGLADTHCVSTMGSDEYPYTTWETAADSIQKAINAASPGDTVMVEPGRYRESITMIPQIALIGAGRNFSYIYGGGYTLHNYTAIQGAYNSTIEGFCIGGSGALNNTGISASGQMKITNNEISGFGDGIYSHDANVEISNNIFRWNYLSIYLDAGPALIINNTFTRNNYGIKLSACRGITVAKNVITNPTSDAISGAYVDSVFIENNLIQASYSYCINLYRESGAFQNVPIRNNTLIGNGNYAVVNIVGFSNEIKNNAISGGYCGIRAWYSCWYFHGIPMFCGSCHSQVSYNDLWSNVENYLIGGGCSIDTSLGGNIYLDPMFVGGGDYHLQYGAPCIDAGDPNIKDPDSSRSDIGCYGGIWGETYTYQDYPPKAPDSLKATSLNTMIVLSWKPNTESDLSHYLVYKDTLAGFIPDTFKIVGEVPKDSSVFRDYDFVLGRAYYYRLSAWDLTGHQSEYSDELQVSATDVDDFTEEGPPMPRMYQLRQNRPNPFNPSTTIVYYLPDVGYQPAEVEIVIYNLLGQRVRTLVKERKYPGEHRVSWDGKDDQGNDLASGIYFYKLTFSGTDLYPLVKPKKMVLIR